MKQVSCILLLIVIIVQSLNRQLIVINYQLNKEIITKKYCENKDKPDLCCNGKCHLKKQLNELDKKQGNPVSSSNSKDLLLFIDKIPTYLFYKLYLNRSYRLIDHEIRYLVFNDKLLKPPTNATFG